MAGAVIKVTIRDQAVMAAFARLEGPELRRACQKNIGVALVKSTRARFQSHRAPDGTAWPALNPTYAAGKRGPGPLVESGHLRDSVVWQLDGDLLRIGTNRIYAGVQNFGGTIVPRTAGALIFRMGNAIVFAHKVTIPARRYLGVSSGDRQTILGIIEDHYEQAWGGAAA